MGEFPKEMMACRNRPEYFYASFHEQWTVVEEYGKLKSKR